MKIENIINIVNIYSVCLLYWPIKILFFIKSCGTSICFRSKMPLYFDLGIVIYGTLIIIGGIVFRKKWAYYCLITGSSVVVIYQTLIFVSKMLFGKGGGYNFPVYTNDEVGVFFFFLSIIIYFSLPKVKKQFS